MHKSNHWTISLSLIQILPLSGEVTKNGEKHQYHATFISNLMFSEIFQGVLTVFNSGQGILFDSLIYIHTE